MSEKSAEKIVISLHLSIWYHCKTAMVADLNCAIPQNQMGK